MPISITGETDHATRLRRNHSAKVTAAYRRFERMGAEMFKRSGGTAFLRWTDIGTTVKVPLGMLPHRARRAWRNGFDRAARQSTVERATRSGGYSGISVESPVDSGPIAVTFDRSVTPRPE